jgi:hypothetical protein
MYRAGHSTVATLRGEQCIDLFRRPYSVFVLPKGEQIPNNVHPTPNVPALLHTVGGIQSSLEAAAGIATGNPVLMALGFGLLGSVAYAAASSSRHAPDHIVLTHDCVIGVFLDSGVSSAASRVEVIPFSAISEVTPELHGPVGSFAPARVATASTKFVTSSVFVPGWGRLRRARAFHLSTINARRLRRALAKWVEENPTPRSETWQARVDLARFVSVARVWD